MKKTLFLLVFLAGFIAAVFAGGSGDAKAGQKSTAAAGPVKLTLILRGGTYSDVIKTMIPAFEKENNVTCEIIDLSFADLHDKIALDARNPKGAYDLLMVDGSWIPEFIEYGVVKNLSDIGYTLDSDFIKEVTVAGVNKAGKVFCVPYFGNVNVFFFNDALLKSVNAPVPTTWNDVLETAKKIQATGKTGYLARAQAGDNITTDFLPVLLSHGGWLFNDKGDVTINTPEFKAALEFYLKLKDAGKIMDKDDIVAAISGGNAGMGLAWPGWYVPKVDGPAHYSVIPTKVNASSPSRPSSIYGVWFLGVAENSQNPQLAMKLLQYITNAENQIASVKLGGVPVRHSAYKDAGVLAANPHFNIVYNALQSGVYRPLVIEWTDITIALGNELDAAVHGVKTVSKALADAQAAVEKIMKK